MHSPLLPPPLRPVFSRISSKIIVQLSPAYLRRMKEELSWIVRGRPAKKKTPSFCSALDGNILTECRIAADSYGRPVTKHEQWTLSVMP